MTVSLPDPFPLLYHAHHSRHAEDIPFWLELAARQGDPILELGCGTGRVLLPLAQAGHVVYGLDNSSGMLAVLRQNLAPALQPSVHIFQADLSSFSLEKRFALILLPCNTFTTLSAEARNLMLERVSQHLLPGGMFAASLPNPRLLASLPSQSRPEVEEVFPHPVDGQPVQVSSAWKRSSARFTVYWTYEHLLLDGSIERVSAQAEHALFPVQTCLQELYRQNFERVIRYGDYDGSLYKRESPYLILVATKPGENNFAGM